MLKLKRLDRSSEELGIFRISFLDYLNFSHNYFAPPIFWIDPSLIMSNLGIRLSKESDINAILKIYDSARQYMRSNGNTSQWNNNYPNSVILREDISKSQNYVITLPCGKIVATFSFIIGNDPTYSIIYNGNWLNDKPYGTVHRIASDGSQKGIIKLCLDWCFGKINNIRIDTMRQNKTMHNLLINYGFNECGTILNDNTEYIAYHKSL